MADREFLGWERPLLGGLVDWFLARRDALPGMLVVVPTAESGRRLREALAEQAGALLSPRVTTPGWFLKARDAEAAPDWAERVAWAEVLEGVADWADFTAIFPGKPEADGGWAAALAAEMVRLRRALQDNGLPLAVAAAKLAISPEADRWQALAKLEGRVERTLDDWGFRSRSRILAEGLEMPAGIGEIVLAGVPEMPPLVERAWLAWPGKLTVLIGAPESEAAHFSPLGRPLADWNERALPWPNGKVQVLADPRQQAAEAVRMIGEIGTASDDLALGSPDAGTGDELARALTRAGWPAFHPAAAMPAGGLALWFRLWGSWLAEPTLARLADLLALPETGILVGGRRAQKAVALAECRDRWMAPRTEDLRRRVAEADFRRDSERKSAEEILEAAEKLEKWRADFLRDFPKTLGNLLTIFAKLPHPAGEVAAEMADWLADAAPVISRVRRGAGYWLDQMLAEIPSPTPVPPPGRAVDVQGWLELYHEPGHHLILCGMNEGKVPARGGGEPWLGEQVRKALGLTTDADRAARDAFLFQALVECRRADGRVDAFCGKSGAGGDALLPSRLLLAAGREDLPRRVNELFREVEPPEAGMRWERDFLWTPKATPPPLRLSATALGGWLACPFRYYLKSVLGMQTPEPARQEWNARDFGTVAHEVLERWGRDTEAREFEKTEAIHAWLSSELDRVVAEWFGKRPPLAVRIQAESLRNRLLWLSRVQAINRVEGWQVMDVERKIELKFGESVVVAKIDRIDRHRDTGRLRVLDYKTGKVDTVEKAHRAKISANAVLPAHLPDDCPAIHESGGKDFLWHNLQLPLYAAALAAECPDVPLPGYFTVGSSAAAVGIHEWSDFDAADLAAAESCAAWVAGQIAAGVFGPPAEKVNYDDFAVLAAGRKFPESVNPVPPATDASASRPNAGASSSA